MDNLQTLNIPFFYGAQDNNDNGGMPFLLPFSYYFDKELNLYRQKSDDNLKQILHNIYLEGSMLNGEMNATDGGHQGKAALDFISRMLPDMKGKRVLEIGCGNGFILKELIKKGAKCVGLEPGPQINEAAAFDEDLELVNDFFPTTKITGDFDLILHFNVLEHLEEPVQMLIDQANLLRPTGKIIFGMPNCEPNLLTGDVSIFMHEHYNYFTRDSFIQVAKHAGLIIDSITTGASNGMIFCSFVKHAEYASSGYVDSNTKWISFEEKAKVSMEHLKNKINEFAPADVAIYCPKRALNALSLLGINDCRLIDDTPEMNGKYLPTFSCPVENLQSLVGNPAKVIVIFSRTFGNIISTNIRKHKELDNSTILLLENFD